MSSGNLGCSGAYRYTRRSAKHAQWQKGRARVTELRQALEAPVARFRAWAGTIPVSERSGEWECLYSGWLEIYTTFSAFVGATSCREWDEDVAQILLYIIARDNEMNELVKDLAKRPDNLLCLGELALTSSERDAKWQLAAEIGRIERRAPQVELLLLQFAHDTDEYVRRCALMALADIGSEKVEELVAAAWKTGDMYQRMAVLYALWKVRSPQLDTYLARADIDGRQYLVEYSARVRSGNPE